MRGRDDDDVDDDMQAPPPRRHRMIVRIQKKKESFEVISQTDSGGSVWQSFALDSSLDSLLQNELRGHTVLELRMMHVKLSTLPSSACSLAMLTKLNLAGNSLVELPREIGSLRNLFFLGLKKNRLQSLPSTIGDLHRLGGLDLRKNDLRCLPWAFCKLRCCDIYLSGNEHLPAHLLVDIYSDHDPAVCGLLLDVALEYSFGGAREAINTMCLIRKFRPESVLTRIPKDVFASVLMPFIWATRFDEEWKNADMLALRDSDFQPIKDHFPADWIDWSKIPPEQTTFY